jgi:hypothetical protein
MQVPICQLNGLTYDFLATRARAFEIGPRDIGIIKLGAWGQMLDGAGGIC